jgi:hypothetical protein
MKRCPVVLTTRERQISAEKWESTSHPLGWLLASRRKHHWKYGLERIWRNWNSFAWLVS